MTTSYESVISEAQLNELSLMVTSEGFTLGAASEELCEDVIDAKSDDATDILNNCDDDDAEEDHESVLQFAEEDASEINNDGFSEQIRYLYDHSDFDIVKTLVLVVVANLKSK
jgi:hypothetical protein